MSCDETRPLLSDYLVGVLAEDPQTQVEEHLTVCAECATELGGLVTLEDDLRALSEVAPAVAPLRSAQRWSGFAVAAGLLLGLGLGIGARALTPAQVNERLVRDAAPPSLLHGALASAGPGDALTLGQPLAVTRESVIDLTGGSLIEASSGSRLELITTRSVRQLAGSARYRVAPGEAPFDVHMPHGRVRALGTIFRVEIQEVQMQKSAKAAAGVAVVIAVVSGVVLVTSNDASQPEIRLEAGQRAVATAGSLSLDTGTVAPVGSESPVAALRAQVAQQQERIATLEAEKAALTKRLADPQDDAPLTKPGLRRAGAAPVTYGQWNEVAELKAIDWKKAATAALKMRQLLPKLLAALAKGETPPYEVRIAIARANQVLAQIALAINGKLPTHVSGNGEYTHPYVLGNLMAAQLEGAGERLAAPQLSLLERLGEEFDLAWGLKQKTYGPQTWQLQKILDEVELKQRTVARFLAELSPAQRDALVDPALAGKTSVDILSPAQMLNGVATPLKVASASELPAKLIGVAARVLGVEAAQLEPFQGVFTTWSRAVKLESVAQGTARFFSVQLVVQAGHAQIRALKELASRLDANDQTQEKLRAEGRVYVPRLVLPKK